VYKELKEKNLELAESLNNVRSLKFQQDGDYFLTSLLLEPLGVNAAKSKNVQIEFFTKQKKEFQFKKYKSEIGGDISISETILLQNKLYIVFFNGDAMGKSMQGAGGALVIGSAIKAIITRTQIEKGNLSTPSEWVKNCFIELQKVFETFDGSMLISGILGLIEDSSGKVYYLNAEHPSAVLYRQEKATILNEKFYLSKIGAPFFRNNFEVEYLELKNQDILILGSDGKDDLALDTENGKIINNDETRFLKIIEEEKAEISSIIKKLGSYGELIDDISLVKIQYTKTN
jgi:serine phosphatase RsbU (regulator of sigma subunit)